MIIFKQNSRYSHLQTQAVYGSSRSRSDNAVVPLYANPLYNGKHLLTLSGESSTDRDEDYGVASVNGSGLYRNTDGAQRFPLRSDTSERLRPPSQSETKNNTALKAASRRCVGWVTAGALLALVVACAALGLVATLGTDSGGGNDDDDSSGSRDTALATSENATKRMNELQEQAQRLIQRLKTAQSTLPLIVASSRNAEAQLANLTATIAKQPPLPTMLRNVVAECEAQSGAFVSQQRLKVAVEGGEIACTTDLTAVKLVPHDGGTGARFGTSVAAGNNDLVAVGAHYADTPQGNETGSVYLYRVSAGDTPPLLISKLVPDELSAGAYFGVSVAFDSASRLYSECDILIAGALYDNTVNRNNTGSAYIFCIDQADEGETYASMIPQLVTKLEADDGAVDDRFGWSVAIANALVAIGAAGDDTEGSEAGAVYLYRINSTAHQLITKLTPTNGAAGDRFGISVAVGGDGLVVVAADQRDTELYDNAGAVFVYRVDTNDDAVQLIDTLVASDGAVDRLFGRSVAVSLNGVIVIGAPGSIVKSKDPGYAYVYLAREGLLPPQFVAKLEAADGVEKDQFGRSVAVGADGLIVVGGWYRDDLGPSSGSAYAYRLTADDMAPQFLTKLLAYDGTAYDYYGKAVAAGGDGLAVIGAFFDDTTQGIDTGSAYAYRQQR